MPRTKNNLDVLSFMQQVGRIGFKISAHLCPNLLSGDPWIFLSIYQHLFYEYKSSISAVVIHNFPPWTLTDNLSQRVRTVFKIMIDVLGYTPHLKMHQFIAEKFARQKMLMCSDILKIVEKLQLFIKGSFLPRNPLLPAHKSKLSSVSKQPTRLTKCDIVVVKPDPTSPILIKELGIVNQSHKRHPMY